MRAMTALCACNGGPAGARQKAAKSQSLPWGCGLTTKEHSLTQDEVERIALQAVKGSPFRLRTDYIGP